MNSDWQNTGPNPLSEFRPQWYSISWLAEVCKKCSSVRRAGTIVALMIGPLMFLYEIAMAQSPSANLVTSEGKALETVSTFSQNLSQWAVMILGGSIVLLLS